MSVNTVQEGQTTNPDSRKLFGLRALKCAEKFVTEKEYGKAFAYYLIYLEMFPENRENWKGEFIGVLYNWCNALEESGRIVDIFRTYRQALHYYPSSVEILSNLGAHLIR